MIIFQRFAHISGLKMNKQTTEAMWLGRNKNNVKQYHNFKRVKQIKTLGIHFKSNTSTHFVEEN